jgi:hypothetical protein
MALGKFYLKKDGKGGWRYTFSGLKGGVVQGRVYVPIPSQPMKLEEQEGRKQAIAEIKLNIAELSAALEKA